jgi:hypothetical protein
VLLSCGGNKPWEREQLEKLQWLRTADAKIAFKKDLKASRIRFYGYYGFASVIPVVGHDPCYRQFEITPIEGTGDVIINNEHLNLIRRAQRFTTKYNQLMKKHIESSGLRSCPPKEG